MKLKEFWHLLFLPHPKNNHRALLLQPSSIGVLIALYLLNQSILKSLTFIKPGILGYSSEITQEKVFIKTNEERRQLGLPPLHFNSTLSQSAQKKAEDMFANNYWAHTSPQKKSPWSFFQEAGYQYTIAGENLAKDFYDTESLMAAWMKSPTHRANIAHQKYQEVGIGVVNGILGGMKTTLVVQHFGTPLGGQIANRTPEEIRLNSATPNQSLVLSDQSLGTSRAINPMLVSKIFGGFMFILIMSVLLIDGYITVKNRHQRLAGSPVSHIGFLAIILLLMLFTRQGSIF